MSETNGNGLGELAAALTAAQTAFPKIVKDKTAKVPTKSGGEYSYRYADLATLLEAVRPGLTANGLALVQPIEVTEQGMVLHTMLLHTSGAHLDSFYPLAAHERPQEMGSEITYSRRYAASAILGVASEDDDDGATAQGASPERPTRGRQQGPKIGVPIEQVGDPTRTSPPTTDAELAQAFPPGLENAEPRDPRPDFLVGKLECPNCGRRVYKRKDGSAWFCWQQKGGCGGQWRVAPANVDTTTGEVTTPADPMAVTAERAALVTRARKLAELVGLTADEMKTSWKTYCGDTTKETANPADVRLYISWLETRWEAKQKSA